MKDRVVAAIDVGTNAVRLRIARATARGLQTVLHQRDPIRPGEGVFSTGSIPRHVADRLIATLRRYKTECTRAGASVRAVATSAVREAKNQGEIVKRVRSEAGVVLEVISGMEEARLTCLGVLEGTPPDRRSLCVDIGGGSTEIALATGERPVALHSIALGAVRITDLFESTKRVNDRKLALMRHFALEALEEGVPGRLAGAPSRAIGSSGTIQAVVAFAAGVPGPRVPSAPPPEATAAQIARAADELAAMTPRRRREVFDDRRADIIVGGAIILEAVMKRLDVESIVAVERGLRDGILVDLVRREGHVPDDSALSEAALAMGRRFLFDERHGRQVARIALALFDGLAGLHRLPASARPYLEVAALLHDVGHAVSYQRHHRHTYYLIQNGDLPGLADRERELVARIARFHRRSPPETTHAFMADLAVDERQIVRKCAVLLRVADSLDRSHHQPVADVRVGLADGVTVTLLPKGPVDLEVWDSAHELELFRRTFGRSLHVRVRGKVPAER